MARAFRTNVLSFGDRWGAGVSVRVTDYTSGALLTLYAEATGTTTLDNPTTTDSLGEYTYYLASPARVSEALSGGGIAPRTIVADVVDPYSGVDMSTRGTAVLHRSGITSADKLTSFGASDVTIAANGNGTGSLSANTTYYATAVPGNSYGSTAAPSTMDSVTTADDATNTKSIRVTIAQCTGATFYDIFLSTDAIPRWVGRVTEAQRAAGDYEITAVGTVASGGGNGAGTVDVNVVGTGITAGNAVYQFNNAYTPADAGITAINCSGQARLYLHIDVALTDLRSQPVLRIVPFFENPGVAGQWHQGQVEQVYLVGNFGQSLRQQYVLEVDGAAGVKVLIDTLSGQGASVTIYTEPV